MSTPLEIEIALWYHTRSGDYEKPGVPNKPAVTEALNRLLQAGLLQECTSLYGGKQAYKGTQGLRVYVEALTSIPWPVQKWVIPEVDDRLSMMDRT